MFLNNKFWGGMGCVGNGIRNVVVTFGTCFKYVCRFHSFFFWFRHVVDIGGHLLFMV
jgi:hypothetical protein